MNEKLKEFLNRDINKELYSMNIDEIEKENVIEKIKEKYFFLALNDCFFFNSFSYTIRRIIRQRHYDFI